MCGCGCELAMILAEARRELDAPAAAVPGVLPVTTAAPDLIERAGHALADAIGRGLRSVAHLVCGWRTVP